MPHKSKLHIPPTCYLPRAIQVYLIMKNVGEFSGKKLGAGTISRNVTRQSKQTAEENKKGDRKGKLNERALRFQTVVRQPQNHVGGFMSRTEPQVKSIPVHSWPDTAPWVCWTCSSAAAPQWQSAFCQTNSTTHWSA